MIIDRLAEGIPQFVAHGLARELADGGFHFRAKDLVGLLAARETDDGRARRKVAVGGKIVERGEKLAHRQIAGGAEDDDAARLRHGPAGEALPQRIGGWCGGRVQSAAFLAPKPKDAKGKDFIATMSGVRNVATASQNRSR